MNLVNVNCGEEGYNLEPHMETEEQTKRNKSIEHILRRAFYMMVSFQRFLHRREDRIRNYSYLNVIDSRCHVSIWMMKTTFFFFRIWYLNFELLINYHYFMVIVFRKWIHECFRFEHEHGHGHYLEYPNKTSSEYSSVLSVFFSLLLSVPSSGLCF